MEVQQIDWSPMRREKWQNSSENLFAVFEGMWNGHISRVLYEHIIMASVVELE